MSHISICESGLSDLAKLIVTNQTLIHLGNSLSDISKNSLSAVLGKAHPFWQAITKSKTLEYLSYNLKRLRGLPAGR